MSHKNVTKNSVVYFIESLNNTVSMVSGVGLPNARRMGHRAWSWKSERQLDSILQPHALCSMHYAIYTDAWHPWPRPGFIRTMQMRLYSLLTEAIVIEMSCRARAGRHLKPVLLKKKIDKSDPYFVNYLRDATLGFFVKVTAEYQHVALDFSFDFIR